MSTASSPTVLEESDFVRLSSVCVDFQPLKVMFRPCETCDQSVVAVMGLFDCEVLVFDRYGALQHRQALQLMLNEVGSNLHVRTVIWIPNSMQVAIVTNKFVKVYDPTECCITAKHTFMLPQKEETIMSADLYWSKDRIVLGTNSRVLVYRIGENSATELMYRTKTLTKTLWHAVTSVRSDVLPRSTSFVSLHFEKNMLHFSTSAKVSST